MHGSGPWVTYTEGYGAVLMLGNGNFCARETTHTNIEREIRINNHREAIELGMANGEVSMECPACHREFPTSLFVSVSNEGDTEEWCPACAEESSSICDHCEERFNHNDLALVGSEEWCESCRDEDSYCCDRCGTHVETTIEVDRGNYWCESCADNYATRCRDCEEHTAENIYTIENRGEVCESCYAGGNYASCAVCGNIFPSDCLHYDADSEEYYCGCDDRSGRCGNGYIHGYSYKPAPVFYSEKRCGSAVPGLRYYGVELEVNCRSVLAESVGRIFKDHAYLKQDGSLNSGFEIVTHPHTFGEQAKLWRKWGEQKPGRITSFESGECGMHVHVNRSALSPMTIQKLLVFINAPENNKLVEYVAQRSSERWAKIVEKKMSRNMRGSGDRYEALNLLPSETIEFRIFRGNTGYARIMKNLEFCDAAISFCAMSSYRELTTERFVEYVRSNRKQYPHLDEFLVEGEYLPKLKSQKVAA